MKVSVIMSAYNNQEFVSQAIESILNQTFANFEFIIVNDGSSDNTEKIIAQYQKRDSRIIIINQENNGLTKSLNTAIHNAKGEYVARQDADDVSYLNRLQEQINFLENNKDIGFVGCSCEIIDEGGKFLNYFCIKNDPKANISKLRKNNIFCHGSMMFRRTMLEKVSGYREFFKYAQDYDLYLRLIESTLPGTINKILYRRRITLESISIQKIQLQSSYANLAKKCYETRLSKKDDSFLLNDSILAKSSKSLPAYDFLLAFMKSLYSIKNNDVITARTLMHSFLLPFRVNKYKLYVLWVLSFMPSFLRSTIFTIKNNLRKAKIALNFLK